MKNSLLDLELVQRARDVLDGAIEQRESNPTLVWRGSARRVLTRRVSVLSQFQVEAAVLHAAVSARCAGDPEGPPHLLIVGAPILPKDGGRNLLALLTAAGCADFSFIIFTPGGPHLVRWDGPLEERDDRQPSPQPIAPRRTFTGAPAQFWVVRALLLASTPARSWWSGPLPSGKAWASATELAKAGRLSISAVTRTLQVLEDRGWVVKERSGFRVLDPSAMLQACAQEGVRRWEQRTPMRLTRSDAQGPAAVAAIWDALKNGPAMQSACAVTGWSALGRHRLAVSAPSARLPEVLLGGSGEGVLARCPMIPVESLRDAQVVVHRGALPADIPSSTTGDMPVVDPLLAMFHVAGDPQGGQEQVHHLHERLLEALSG